MLALVALAVAGDVDALGAGIADDALEPMLVAHQAVPRRPSNLGGGDGLGRADLLARQADGDAHLLDDLPMRLAAAELVVGDDLLGTRVDDVHLGVPMRTVRRDAQLQYGV